MTSGDLEARIREAPPRAPLSSAQTRPDVHFQIFAAPDAAFSGPLDPRFVGAMRGSGPSRCADRPACGHAGPLALIYEMSEASEWPEAVMVARVGVLS